MRLDGLPACLPACLPAWPALAEVGATLAGRPWPEMVYIKRVRGGACSARHPHADRCPVHVRSNRCSSGVHTLCAFRLRSVSVSLR